MRDSIFGHPTALVQNVRRRSVSQEDAISGPRGFLQRGHICLRPSTQHPLAGADQHKASQDTSTRLGDIRQPRSRPRYCVSSLRRQHGEKSKRPLGNLIKRPWQHCTRHPTVNLTSMLAA